MQSEQSNARPLSTPLLTARQVADLVGVGTDTVLRWTRAGKVPALHLPSGQVRYRHDQIDAWLDQRATRPTSVADVVRQTVASIQAERRN